jgi:cytidine deaminase
MTLTHEERNALIALANEVRQNAYVPYSNYRVGAVVRTKSGRTFTGVNIENASYSNTLCAERVAIFKAVSEGERDLEAIVVVTDNGGTPCGSCRQVLAEFGTDIVVLVADGNGTLHLETTVGALLPAAFTLSPPDTSD